MDEGLRLVWIRKKASAGYEIWRPGAEKPEEFWKLGRGGVPEEVRDALRLDPVVTEGGAVDVHVGNQREPVFLLNKPGSAAAAFFAASSESAHLLAMQARLKERITDAKRDCASAEADIQAQRARLDRLANLPDIQLQAELARLAQAGLEQSEAALPRLSGLLERASRLKDQAGGMAARRRALADLVPAPDLQNTARLRTLAQGLADLGRKGRTARNQTAALAGLAAPESLFPAQPLADRLGQAKALARKAALAREQCRGLADLQPSPTLFNTAPLAGTAASLARVACMKRKAAQDLAALNARLAEALAAVERRLAEVGSCPLCHADLEAARFLGGKGGGS